MVDLATAIAAIQFAEPIFKTVVGLIKVAEDKIKGYKKGPDRKAFVLEEAYKLLGEEGLWKDLPEGEVKEVMAKISDQIETWVPILKKFGYLETKYDVQPEDISETPGGKPQ